MVVVGEGGRAWVRVFLGSMDCLNKLKLSLSLLLYYCSVIAIKFLWFRIENLQSIIILAIVVVTGLVAVDITATPLPRPCQIKACHTHAP